MGLVLGQEPAQEGSERPNLPSSCASRAFPGLTGHAGKGTPRRHHPLALD